MGGGLGRVTKHPDYYLSDGSVSFLTGNVLFRVHRTFFERESEVFRDLFANAAEDDPQAGTDARPFTLDDVNPHEFEQLLWVWYDTEYSYHSQTKDNWITILRLSTRWGFSRIRNLAIRALEALALSPAERISIYNTHAVAGEQLHSAYVELCRSPTVPTEADGRLIPLEILMKILQAREDAQRRAVELGLRSPTSASLQDDALREIISERFGEGLNPQSHGTSTGSGGQASDLNGERAHATRASTPTITIGEPQVPGRTAQAGSRPSSHLNNSLQMGSEGGQEKGKEVENKTAREKAKEKEEEKQEAKQEKGKEPKEKQEQPQQEKEKEAGKKEQKTDQKQPQNTRGKRQGN